MEPNQNGVPFAKAKPVHEVRLGLIKAAIWKNENNGVVRYNTTFNRLYKSGDNWQSSDNFGRDDLLIIAKVADQTHSWICAQPQEPSDNNDAD